MKDDIDRPLQTTFATFAAFVGGKGAHDDHVGCAQGCGKYAAFDNWLGPYTVPSCHLTYLGSGKHGSHFLRRIPISWLLYGGGRIRLTGCGTRLQTIGNPVRRLTCHRRSCPQTRIPNGRGCTITTIEEQAKSNI